MKLILDGLGCRWRRLVVWSGGWEEFVVGLSDVVETGSGGDEAMVVEMTDGISDGPFGEAGCGDQLAVAEDSFMVERKEGESGGHTQIATRLEVAHAEGRSASFRGVRHGALLPAVR